MRGWIIVIFTLVVMASFGFVAANMSDANKKAETKEESKIFEFSTFTFAVCDSEKDFVNCKDEVFVNCDGKISKAVDVAECNGIKLNIPKATGFAVFEKEWEDPRG